jgi:hypothetical protein
MNQNEGEMGFHAAAINHVHMLSANGHRADVDLNGRPEGP